MKRCEILFITHYKHILKIQHCILPIRYVLVKLNHTQYVGDSIENEGDHSLVVGTDIGVTLGKDLATPTKISKENIL
jgi:hypothetical protein